MSKAGRTKTAGRTRKGRANGHGTLEKRPNGTFLGRWQADGKRYSQIIRDADGNPVTDRRTAEGILSTVTAPYRLGSAAATAECLAAKAAGKQAELKVWKDNQPALRIKDGFAAFLKSAQRTNRAGASTLDRYEMIYNALEKWLKVNRPDYVELRDITQKDAKTYAEHLQGTMATGTYNGYMTVLRHIWNVLRDEDTGADGERVTVEAPRPGELPEARLTCNPWTRIKNRVGAPHSRRVLTVNEMTRLCTSVTGEMRQLFALGFYTGMRLSDCCLLKWERIDLRKGVIYTIPKKTAKHGTAVFIPICAPLAAVLCETPAAARSGYVMPNLAARYQRQRSLVSRDLRRVFIAADIEVHGEKRASGLHAVEVGFHSLRHTFVSMLGNSGAPLALVQAMVGHTSKEMTQHYFHESEGALRSAVGLLPNVLGPHAGEVIDITAEDAPKTAIGAQGETAGTVAPVIGADAAAGRFAAFRDLVAQMDAGERAQAAAWLANFNTNTGK